jgi:hypothetical protein
MAIKHRNLYRGFISSLIIGWRIETNWASPINVLFVKTIRPISSAIILSIMYSVASRGSNLKDLLWVIIGISTWGLVQSQVELMYWAITSEREWLRNIKNIILSPTPFFIYFFTITIVSNIFLNLNITLESVLFFEFTLSLVIGLVILFFLGLLTAGITLNVPRTPIGVGEAIVGLLYLISGSIIRPEILPSYIQNFSTSLPLIHWIELVRFSIHPVFRDNPYDWESLLFTSVVFSIGCFLSYVFLFKLSRKHGKIDQATMY